MFKQHLSWAKKIRIWPSRKTLSLDWFDGKVNWIITRAITFSWNKQEVTAKLNKFWSSCFFQARRQLLWDLTLTEIISSSSQKLRLPVEQYHHTWPHLGFYTHARIKIWFQRCVSHNVGSWTHPLSGVNPPSPQLLVLPSPPRTSCNPSESPGDCRAQFENHCFKSSCFRNSKWRHIYIKILLIL